MQRICLEASHPFLCCSILSSGVQSGGGQDGKGLKRKTEFKKGHLFKAYLLFNLKYGV